LGHIPRAGKLAHVPAKHALGLDPRWNRFADKDMRQHTNLRRLPVISDY
jgi:hypothetical protein